MSTFFLVCNKCNNEKNETEFYPYCIAKNRKLSVCKKCVIDRNKTKKTKDYHKKYFSTIKGKAKSLFIHAKIRAIKRNYDFTITENYIEQLIEKGICSKTGLKFDLTHDSETHRNPLGPSIDRINNQFGYTPENIQIVCNIYNGAKNDYDEQILIDMCVAVIEINRNNSSVKKLIERLKINDASD